MQKPREIRLRWLLLTPVLLWSTVFPLSKLLLEVVPPTTLAAMRFSVGALVLLTYASYVFSWREMSLSLARRWKSYLALGFIGVFLNNFLQNLGLTLTSASSAALLGTLDPIFTAVLSLFLLGEKFTRSKAAGLVCAFSGVILVITNGRWIQDWGQSVGNLLVVGAALGYSVYTLGSKAILRSEKPPMVVAWATTIGAVMLVFAALALEGWPSLAPLTVTQMAVLAYLSIVPTSIAVVAYFYLLERIEASQASVTLFLIPVFAITWAVLLLGEHLTTAMLTGGALIIFGVWLTMLERKT